MINLLLLVFLLIVVLGFSLCENPGIQLKLTENGIKYAVKEGLPYLRDDLLSEMINYNGESGNLEFKLQNLHMSKIDFGEVFLTPISGRGIKCSVNIDIIEAVGIFFYNYKTIFGINIHDTIGFNVNISNVESALSVEIGSNKDGRPSINFFDCSLKINSLTVQMNGKDKWLYDLINPLVESTLEIVFSQLFCNIVKTKVEENIKNKLATFTEIINIDSLAKIDLSLTQPPNFTDNYVQFFFKGKFLLQNDSSLNQFLLPQPTVSDEDTQMLYLWITDYTINTAAEVYHKGGALTQEIYSWDPKTPKDLQKFLQTSTFTLFFPGLLKYGGEKMALFIRSYKPPQVLIEKDDFKINLFTEGMFKVRDNDLTLDAFLIKFDIKAVAEIFVSNNKITAKISAFDYDAVVVRSYVGSALIPLDSFLIKKLVDAAIIKNANSFLDNGFSLPPIRGNEITNLNIKLLKNTVQVGGDVHSSAENMVNSLLRNNMIFK
ncbi:lipopolysaccharide-binding protein isoform X1 [Hydra vulgaris]|uniref:lipopolysaccharide-binding protein isoform X1 n=1 Tax=Hydra vulgaris TaxID=6087 RepID=UPI001F5E6677|nr:lipopolysaccharide-binding protein [Hydra vulgaris]